MIRSKQLLFEIVNLLPTFTSEEPRPKMKEDIARLKKLVLKQHCYLRIMIKYIFPDMNSTDIKSGTKNLHPLPWPVGHKSCKRLSERARTLTQNIEDKGLGEASASADVSNADLGEKVQRLRKDGITSPVDSLGFLTCKVEDHPSKMGVCPKVERLEDDIDEPLNDTTADVGENPSKENEKLGACGDKAAMIKRAASSKFVVRDGISFRRGL